MKEQILALRIQGKTYNEIRGQLGCSKATISYHCGPGQKAKTVARTKRLRKINPLLQKLDCFKQAKQKPPRVKGPRPDTGDRCVYRKISSFMDPRRGVLGDTFTTADVLIKFPNPVCCLTGDPIDLYKVDSYSFDHIIPVCKGGTNTLNNLGLTTATANQMKGKMTVPELLIACQKVLVHHGFTVILPQV